MTRPNLYLEVGPEWYHQWFLNESNPGTLYVTTKGHFVELPSFNWIGNSKQIGWLEKKLSKTPSIPIDEVFYPLDISEMNKQFNSPEMRDWMNARVGSIGEGSRCKIRELIYDRPIDPPRLVLFHDYFDRAETDSLLRDFITFNGERNYNFRGSVKVGNMFAVSSLINTLELVPEPILLEHKIDYTPAIETIRAKIPEQTLGNVLGPLIEKYISR